MAPWAGVWVAAAVAAAAVWLWVPAPPLGRLAAGRSRAVEGVGALLAGWGRWVAPLRSRRDQRREADLRASVPEVCELLAVCLDAGRPPRTALRVVAGVVRGPVTDALAGVLLRIDLGVDEAEAWASLCAVPGYREVGRDLSRSVRSGLGLAALLRQHGVEARREAAASALVVARAVGVKSVVPLMLCFLPAFMLLGVVPIFGAFVATLVP